MRTGQIIRKKLKSGTPIGPWLQIIKFCGQEMLVRVLESQFATNKTTVISREEAYTPQSASIPVDKMILRRINSGLQYAVEHPVLKRWKPEHDQCEIVKLYDYHGGCSWFTVERLVHVYNSRERKGYIRVVLGQKLLQL